jgi:hypothetical protein
MRRRQLTRFSRDAQWPADLPKNVHHIQARKAFGPRSDAYLARLRSATNEKVTVERTTDGSAKMLVTASPDRLAAILGREDVTRVGGNPLVLVSEARHLMAIATGPSDAPARIAICSNVSRLENGQAVEIPSPDDTQPSWQLVPVVPLGERGHDGQDSA